MVQVDQLRGQVTVHIPNPRSGERSKSFTFDSVFGFESKQADIYNETARPIVDFVLEGYNGKHGIHEQYLSLYYYGQALGVALSPGLLCTALCDSNLHAADNVHVCAHRMDLWMRLTQM